MVNERSPIVDTDGPGVSWLIVSVSEPAQRIDVRMPRAHSAAIRDIRHRIRQLAVYEPTVQTLGDSGDGREFHAGAVRPAPCLERAQ